MLVQLRQRGLRLVRQHDHALAAGRLAHAWGADGAAAGAAGTGGRGGDGGRLPFRLVLAVALHDVAWRGPDRRPRLDPETGRPFSFHRHPLPEKLGAYTRGLDEMEAVDPWVGLLGSLHYASFLEGEEAADFLRREEARRRRLRARIGAREGDDSEAGGGAGPGEGAGTGDADPGGGVLRRARRALRWLKFFDGLSLRLCLAPPDVPEASVPGWIGREEPVAPPAGPASALRWLGPRRAVLEPFPLHAPVTLEIPVRDLPARRYGGQRELEDAWAAAPERTWRLALCPPEG